MTKAATLETLERAERWARTCASATAEEAGTEAAALGCRLLALIVAELTRLRAEVARLQEELRHRTIDTNIHATHADSMREVRDVALKRAEAAESELARLQSAPSRVLHVPSKNDDEALDAVTGRGFYTADPAKVAGWVRGGETVRVVELRVRP